MDDVDTKSDSRPCTADMMRQLADGIFSEVKLPRDYIMSPADYKQFKADCEELGISNNFQWED